MNYVKQFWEWLHDYDDEELEHDDNPNWKPTGVDEK